MTLLLDLARMLRLGKLMATNSFDIGSIYDKIKSNKEVRSLIK